MPDSYKLRFEGGPLDGCVIDDISGDNPPILEMSICVDPARDMFIYYGPHNEDDITKEEYVMVVTQDDHEELIDPGDDPAPCQEDDDDEDFGEPCIG